MKTFKTFERGETPEKPIFYKFWSVFAVRDVFNNLECSQSTRKTGENILQVYLHAKCVLVSFVYKLCLHMCVLLIWLGMYKVNHLNTEIVIFFTGSSSFIVPSRTRIFAHTRMGLSHMRILIWAAHTHIGSPYAYGIALFLRMLGIDNTRTDNPVLTDSEHGTGMIELCARGHH